MTDNFGPGALAVVRHPLRRRGQQLLFLPVCVIATLLILATVSNADEKHSHANSQSHDEVASPQTECPVMVGNKIDPSIYSDFRGKRVFLCCMFCYEAFTKDPEKYLEKLPQFSIGDSEADENAASGHNENDNASATGHEHADDDPHGLARVIRFAGRFHPIAVHFPIALIMAAAAAELLGFFASTGKSLFLNASRFMISVGALSGITAWILGLATGASANFPPEFIRAFDMHRWVGTSASFVIVVCAVLCELSYRRNNAAGRTGYRVALVLSVVLMAMTGYLGGTLVYGLDHYTW